MKKYLLSLIIVLFSLELVYAQQYVVTTPTKKNVILEEYTGAYCTYCPDGHRIANELAAQNPGRIFPINIHAGGYAPTSYPNMTTPEGNEFNNSFGVYSYPSGVVNRATGAIGRNMWEEKSMNQMKETAIVNIAGDYTINAATRTAQITVEIYYTDNSSVSTNYLNIFMLQDNVIGYQAGSNLNPTQIVDGQYCHTHVFRSTVTSTWGDAITPTTGSLITKTYTYTIPETIGDPNGVAVDLDNIYFVAFLTDKNDSNGVVLNACELGVPSPAMYVIDLCQGDSYIENGFNFTLPFSITQTLKDLCKAVFIKETARCSVHQVSTATPVLEQSVHVHSVPFRELSVLDTVPFGTLAASSYYMQFFSEE